MSGSKVYEDFCYNEVKTERVKFEFMIKEFSKRNGEIVSVTFPSSGPKEVGKWILALLPNGSVIYVHVNEETSTVNTAKVIFSLMNDKGDLVKDTVKQYNNDGACVLRLERNFLEDKANGVLPNDELTIVCRIEIRLLDVSHSHGVLPAKREPPPCRLAEDLGKLLASGALSDVTIAVAGAELKAHKNVLAARSAVFAAMFSNQMLEKETGVVEIIDMQAVVVQAMLEFIYTGKDVSQTGWAHDLLAAADKYQLERLKFMCEEALCKALTLDNVLENLALADLYSAARLKEQCISLVMKHKAEILGNPSWNVFKRSHQSVLAEIFEKLYLQERKMNY